MKDNKICLNYWGSQQDCGLVWFVVCYRGYEDEDCMDDVPLMYNEDVTFEMGESESLVDRRRYRNRLFSEGLSGLCSR